MVRPPQTDKTPVESHDTQSAARGVWRGWRRYWGMTGPGYLQSAMTLGAGTTASCVLLGGLAGYTALWIQPLAILIGAVFLSLVARMTLTTGKPAYTLFAEDLTPWFAKLWAISALVATVVWHFPQYALAADGLRIVLQIPDAATGVWVRGGLGLVLLLSALVTVLAYRMGARGLRFYEITIKVLVWLIVIAFAAVALVTGIRWRYFFEGITGLSFLRWVSSYGIHDEHMKDLIKPLIGGLAAAVGVNMVFLYPYSLLQKKWGAAERDVALYDLAVGMVVPFTLATTLTMIAVANTVGPVGSIHPAMVRDITAILPVLASIWDETTAALILGAGMFAIGFSTIVTHMLACVCIGSALFGISPSSKRATYLALIPAVGVFGVAIRLPWYASVTASTLALPFMPLAVVGFVFLLYRGQFAQNGGMGPTARTVWTGFLLVYALILSVAAIFGLRQNWNELSQRFFSETRTSATSPTDSSTTEQSSPRLPYSASSNSPSPTDNPRPSKEPAHPPLQPPTPTYVFQDEAMATQCTWTLCPMNDAAQYEDVRMIAEAAFAEVRRVETILSSWLPTSEVNRLQTEAVERPVRVSPTLASVLDLSLRIAQETQGAFDPTVGALLRAWKFYSQGEGSIPTREQIEAALAHTGYHHVAYDAAAQTVRLARSDLALDFGGVGKGFALDAAAALLQQQGIPCGLLEAGRSSALAFGTLPPEQGWTIRLDYTYNEQKVNKVFTLRDGAFSSSMGSARALAEVGQKRYGHILDPRSGMPVDNGMRVACAFAPTGAESDALSTAFFVMGPAEAARYCAAHPSVRGWLLYEEGEVLRSAWVDAQGLHPETPASPARAAS